MPQMSSVPGVAGVIQRPSGGQQGINPEEFARLAIAVKQVGMQEKAQKQQEAQQALQNMVSMYHEFGMLPDKKEADKVIKAAGLNYKSFDEVILAQPGKDQSAAPASAAPAAAPQAGPLPASVTPQKVTELGKTIQPIAGAAAANPPASPQAPAGGGVTKGTTPSLTEHLVSQLEQGSGGLRRMYEAQGMRQQADQMLAQKQAAIRGHMNNFEKTGDVSEIAKAYVQAEIPVSKDMISNMIIAASDPAARADAIKFATGGRTSGDKAKDYSAMVTSIMTNTEALSKFPNPEAVAAFAQAATSGDPIPRINYNPLSLAQLKQVAENRDKLIEQYGLPLEMADNFALKMMFVGGNLSNVLPDTVDPLHLYQSNKAQGAIPKGFDVDAAVAGFKSNVERKMGVAEKEAAAKQLEAQARMVQAKADAGQLALAQEKYKTSGQYQVIFDNFSRMTDAVQHGVLKADDPAVQESIAAIGSIPELGFTVKRVNDIMKWLTGGTHLETELNQPTEPTPGQPETPAQKARRETARGSKAKPIAGPPTGGGFTPEVAGKAAVGTAIDLAKLPYRATKMGMEMSKATFDALVGAARGAAKEVKKRTEKQ